MNSVGGSAWPAIELDASTVDLALFVVAHELFHTLGASDKYDANGRAMIPDGLVEAQRVPLYPQRYAEVMTRNLVLAAGSERPPDSLAELGVGTLTAARSAGRAANPQNNSVAVRAGRVRRTRAPRRGCLTKPSAWYAQEHESCARALDKASPLSGLGSLVRVPRLLGALFGRGQQHEWRQRIEPGRRQRIELGRRRNQQRRSRR